MSPATEERTGALAEAAALLGSLGELDAPLGGRTTYRVGGRAGLFVIVPDEAALPLVSRAVGVAGGEVLVLGKGSNLLVADAGFPGIVVSLGEGFETIEFARDATVVAGGATPYPVLARRSAAAGLSGMEWAVGVPGSVGGAVRMNAGGHGASTAERLLSASLYDLRTGEGREAPARSLSLSYRHSAVRRDELVTRARFALSPGERSSSEALISEIVAWRREHQPGGQNAGSVFENPPGDSAGRLVEAAGGKGLSVGSATVSEKHANFIQCAPGGSADDVRRLIDQVRRLVEERLGVELQLEVQLVGFGQ